jgi:DNA-binding response OmpR family regulator
MAKILIVDGDERFRQACFCDLCREGHEVRLASTGFEALASADERRPDLVISEVGLPGMDGLDLMARLLARHRGIKIILNSRSPGYKDSFMSWAADACLIKSTDDREVLAKVRELMTAKAANATAQDGSDDRALAGR